MAANTHPCCPSCFTTLSRDTKFCPNCGQSVVKAFSKKDEDSLLGTFVGRRFAVISKLGEGGMGAVYRAEQVAMKRPVALKVLHTRLSRDKDIVERFHREAAASSRLTHPNTITVYDFGQTDTGTLYIAMELVDGRSLSDEIKKGQGMAWQRVAHIGSQLAASLVDAHRAGVIHRDLKPDNIMLMERAGTQDFVKILDFGIAKLADIKEGLEDKRHTLTRTGKVFGTPQYMSPEQIRAEDVDHRSDVYSFGIILYELLTGCLPFVADKPMGMLSKHLTETPRAFREVSEHVDCPDRFEQIVFRCLRKKPAQRWQTMEELHEVLTALSAAKPARMSQKAPSPEGDPSPQPREAAATSVLEAMPTREQAQPSAGEPMPEPRPTFAAGHVFQGRYEVARPLGEGDLGAVFKARDTSSNDQVALKVLGAKAARYDSGAAQRYLDRAVSATELGSVFIADVLDSGITDQGAPFVVTEYLEGEDLRSRLAKLGTMEPQVAVDVVLQVCRALDRAHEGGIVHGALKPSNVFWLSRDADVPHVKLLDFGVNGYHDPSVVRCQALSKKEQYLADPIYLAPELLMDVDGPTPASDVYGAGLLLYELLTGTHPFAGETYGERLMAVASAEFGTADEHNEDVSAELAMVVARALERQPDLRYSSIRELASALSQFGSFTDTNDLGDLEVQRDTFGSAPTDDWRSSRVLAVPSGLWKKAALAAGGALVVLIAIVGIGMSLGGGGRESSSHAAAHVVPTAASSRPGQRDPAPARPDSQQLADSALDLAETEPTRAVEMARRVVDQDPSQSTAWFVIAFVEQQRGNNEAAREAVAQCLEAQGPHKLACRSLTIGGEP